MWRIWWHLAASLQTAANRIPLVPPSPAVAAENTNCPLMSQSILVYRRKTWQCVRGAFSGGFLVILASHATLIPLYPRFLIFLVSWVSNLQAPNALSLSEIPLNVLLDILDDFNRFLTQVNVTLYDHIFKTSQIQMIGFYNFEGSAETL